VRNLGSWGMTNDEFADNEETAARAIDVIAILTEGFDALADSGSVNVDYDKGLVFLTAYGWWAGITRSAQAISTLHQSGLAHESAPIVRTVLQHTLALQWLVETGDKAVAAVQEYTDDNTRKLLKTLAEANWPPSSLTMNGTAKTRYPQPTRAKVKEL